VPAPEFDPESIVRVLEHHGVDWVLIGGFAAVIHGSPYVTTDIDVVPAPGEENLRRLSGALREMHARVWTNDVPEGLPFDHSAGSLADGRIWNLVTDFGRLDLTFEPSGTRGYDDLIRGSVRLEILGSEVMVASLADVIRSKEAAGRDKDKLVLPVLWRLLEETDPSR
jgi:hypothetical protein